MGLMTYCGVLTELLVPNLQKLFLCFHLHILEILSASPMHCHAVSCAHLTQGHMLSCKTPQHCVCVYPSLKQSNADCQLNNKREKVTEGDSRCFEPFDSESSLVLLT